MYLRDYLHDVPLKVLKVIANSLNVTVEYQARIKLINAIDKAFWYGTLIGRLLNSLSDDHRHLLSIIAFSYDVGVSEKALIKKIEKITGINKLKIKKLIDDLLSLSLVGGIKGDDAVFFCPRGVAEQIRKILIRDVIEPYDESYPIPSASSPNILEDIFSLLSLIYKKDISLTLMGRIKKAVLDRAFSGSPTCSNTVQHFPEDYRNTFIIDYLKEKKLVSFDNRKVQTTKNLSGWLELSMTERFQDIVSYALSHTLHDDFTIIALTGLLVESTAGSRFDIKKLAYFFHSNTLSQGGFPRLESKVLSILNIFTQLGLFSLIENRFIMTMTGERFFRNENLPFDDNISGFFTMQPNFEVIVGPELDPRVRFKLELLASKKNRDMALTYVVTQEGINRARERGMSIEDTLNFFKEHSRNPVPQNVQFSIESWAKDYGSIYFEDTVLMRFRDTNTCNSIAHMPEVAPYIKEQLSSTVLVISLEHIPIITSKIKNAGYQPEVYGITIQDNASSGGKFIPNNINKLLEKNKLPEIHNNFIFPEHLLSDQGKQ